MADLVVAQALCLSCVLTSAATASEPVVQLGGKVAVWAGQRKPEV